MCETVLERSPSFLYEALHITRARDTCESDPA